MCFWTLLQNIQFAVRSGYLDYCRRNMYNNYIIIVSSGGDLFANRGQISCKRLINDLHLTGTWRTHTIDHEMHDGLGNQVSDGLVNDADVGIDQVADGFHLTLQLRIHWKSVCRGGLFSFGLRKKKKQTEGEYKTQENQSVFLLTLTRTSWAPLFLTQINTNKPDPFLDKLQPWGRMPSSCPHPPENHRPAQSDEDPCTRSCITNRRKKKPNKQAYGCVG